MQKRGYMWGLVVILVGAKNWLIEAQPDTK